MFIIFKRFNEIGSDRPNTCIYKTQFSIVYRDSILLENTLLLLEWFRQIGEWSKAILPIFVYFNLCCVLDSLIESEVHCEYGLFTFFMLLPERKYVYRNNVALMLFRHYRSMEYSWKRRPHLDANSGVLKKNPRSSSNKRI